MGSPVRGPAARQSCPGGLRGRAGPHRENLAAYPGLPERRAARSHAHRVSAQPGRTRWDCRRCVPGLSGRNSSPRRLPAGPPSPGAAPLPGTRHPAAAGRASPPPAAPCRRPRLATVPLPPPAAPRRGAAPAAVQRARDPGPRPTRFALGESAAHHRLQRPTVNVTESWAVFRPDDRFTTGDPSKWPLKRSRRSCPSCPTGSTAGRWRSCPSRRGRSTTRPPGR